MYPGIKVKDQRFHSSFKSSMKTLRYVVWMESLLAAVILTIIFVTTDSPNYFPFTPLGLQAPLPMFLTSLWSVKEGERCIDRTSCTSGVQSEGYSNPFFGLSASPSGPQSPLACLPMFQLRGGSRAAPMTAGWGRTSTAGWGSGCRPPRWARPSWRCGCPGRGCCQHGEAWRWTRSAPISGGPQWFTGKK